MQVMICGQPYDIGGGDGGQMVFSSHQYGSDRPSKGKKSTSGKITNTKKEKKWQQ